MVVASPALQPLPYVVFAWCQCARSPTHVTVVRTCVRVVAPTSQDEAAELLSSVKDLLGIGHEPENSHWLKMYRKEGGKMKRMVGAGGVSAVLDTLH